MKHKTIMKRLTKAKINKAQEFHPINTNNNSNAYDVGRITWQFAELRSFWWREEYVRWLDGLNRNEIDSIWPEWVKDSVALVLYASMENRIAYKLRGRHTRHHRIPMHRRMRLKCSNAMHRFPYPANRLSYGIHNLHLIWVENFMQKWNAARNNRNHGGRRKKQRTGVWLQREPKI